MERSEVLKTLTFSDGNPVEVDLPLSCIIKQIIVDIWGSVVATYTGSPVAYPTNIMDILIPNISVMLSNGRTPKSIRPATAHLFNQLMAGVPRIRRATTGAAAYALPKAVDVDAAFTYPTSTQYATFFESLVINFEVPPKLALNGSATYLNLYGETYASLKFQCGSFANMEGTGVSVAYSATAVYIDTTLITVNENPNKAKLDFRESTKAEQFSAAVSNFMTKIPTGKRLIGIGILAESNMSNTGSVETLHKLSNIALTDLRFFVNTDRVEKTTTFLRLQAENRIKNGINAAFSSNVSPFDGYAFLNFLEGKDLATSLDLRTGKGVADAYLEITTGAARAAAPFLTYPIKATMHIYELADIPKQL